MPECTRSRRAPASDARRSTGITPRVRTLVAAIEARARATFDRLVAALPGGEPRAALERFVGDLLALREGYDSIAVRSAPRPEAQLHELWTPVERHVRDL